MGDGSDSSGKQEGAGRRPGAIIETEDQLVTKSKILKEMESKIRVYPDWLYEDYGELEQDSQSNYDIDDSDALDASTLGTWTIEDLRSKFDYEWDPNSDEPDPNLVEMNQENVRYVEQNEIDEDGVEIGYDPIFGPSNPIDTRAILGAKESYMVDERTRDESMFPRQFDEDDPEFEYNEDVVQFRRSLDVMETYVDPFLPGLEIPRHVAKWHGYPEQKYFEPKNFTNNRFTENPTDFDALPPYRARELAVQMARAKNAEWLPIDVSLQWHKQQREPYDKYNTLVGTLKKGDCDPDIVQLIQPVLKVLGSCADLLSIEGTIFRFHYHGLIKNKYGIQCWTESMIQDCGVEVTSVIFETGFRKRDPLYDGGDPWYNPSF
jgi:hypothetical protein